MHQHQIINQSCFTFINIAKPYPLSQLQYLLKSISLNSSPTPASNRVSEFNFEVQKQTKLPQNNLLKKKFPLEYTNTTEPFLKQKPKLQSTTFCTAHSTFSLVNMRILTDQPKTKPVYTTIKLKNYLQNIRYRKEQETIILNQILNYNIKRTKNNKMLQILFTCEGNLISEPKKPINKVLDIHSLYFKMAIEHRTQSTSKQIYACVITKQTLSECACILQSLIQLELITKSHQIHKINTQEKILLNIIQNVY
eukprot:TRINITY_DN9016_c2_g1_i2.p2 TRINITY_DN9016_c2_g1~~TRINITY_DN9016_c2_g1_i2.p2  ORF type:complete len:252 (+),score=-11.43 TRINITY_DN9016_c2_g1_i2:190-945(+)